jgi:hypothetical protein
VLNDIKINTDRFVNIDYAIYTEIWAKANGGSGVDGGAQPISRRRAVSWTQPRTCVKSGQTRENGHPTVNMRSSESSRESWSSFFGHPFIAAVVEGRNLVNGDKRPSASPRLGGGSGCSHIDWRVQLSEKMLHTEQSPGRLSRMRRIKNQD